MMLLGQLIFGDSSSRKWATVARRGIAVIVLLCSNGSAFAQTSPDGSSTVLVKAGRLLDVKTGDYRIDQGILIVDERIKEVGPLAVIPSHPPKDPAVHALTHVRGLPRLIYPPTPFL